MTVAMEQLVIREFKLSELNPAPYNPRTISDESLEGLTNSLRKFGCVEPIVVNNRDGKNTIVGGHQRHKALLQLYGKDHVVSCVVVDLDEVEEKLLNLALNNPEIQGDFIENLGDYIEKLKDQISDPQSLIDLRINQLRGIIDDVDFQPTDDEPNLDQLEPLMIKCPHCGEKFDARKQM